VSPRAKRCDDLLSPLLRRSCPYSPFFQLRDLQRLAYFATRLVPPKRLIGSSLRKRHRFPIVLGQCKQSIFVTYVEIHARLGTAGDKRQRSAALRAIHRQPWIEIVAGHRPNSLQNDRSVAISATFHKHRDVCPMARVGAADDAADRRTFVDRFSHHYAAGVRATDRATAPDNNLAGQ